jgi:chemotaxis protein MotB
MSLNIEPNENPQDRSASAHDESNWLVSYADMMTLLCGFFILLFSFSTIDPPKYEKVKESIAKQFGGTVYKPKDELIKTLTQKITDQKLKDAFEVRSDAFGVSIVFQSTFFFPTLSAEILKQGLQPLETLSKIIGDTQKEKNKKYYIVIEGHTDSRAILGGLYASNWELSAARAARVVRFFLNKGFPPKSLTAIGYADTRPLLPDQKPDGTWDDEALAKNRRVVVRLIDPTQDSFTLKVENTEKNAELTKETK